MSEAMPTQPTPEDFLDDPEYRSMITGAEWLAAHIMAVLIFLEEKFGAEIAAIAAAVYSKFGPTEESPE